MKIKKLSYLLIIMLVFFSGCKRTGPVSLEPYLARLDAVPHKRWEALAQKRVFFGHKSVGMNILDGLRDVMKIRPFIKLDIRESDDPSTFIGPVFAHALVGTNFQPQTKIDRFEEIMKAGVGQAGDIAFLKFCFVDVGHSTDLKALLDSYSATMERLISAYPEVKFVSFTVPLLSGPVGWKTRLKKLLGRLPNYDTDHVQRNIYNDMLRARFKGHLFDIAAIESRISDTNRAMIKKGGGEYEILYRGYTHDGGHLNPIGRQIVAIELLLYLASITTD